MNYGLYKRIMKHDPKAIDEVETLEEAKEIIKMMTGNVYLNGEAYNHFLPYYTEQLQERYISQHLKNNPDIDIDLNEVSNGRMRELVQEIINNQTK